MGQTTDFDKLRRRRRRNQLIRRVAVLAVVFLVISGVLSMNRLLVDISFLGSVNDFIQGFGGKGYPIPTPGGTIRDAKSLGGDVAVLNDTNLYIYNSKGKELQGIQRMSDATVLLTAGNRALTYDVGGTRFKLYSRSNLLLDGDNEYNLTSAALGQRGDYALVSSSRQYTAQVSVFDARFELEFQWFSNELVAAVALSPTGGNMAAGCVGARDGVLLSTVLLFAFDTPNETARLELADELLLYLEYLDEDLIGILTDRSYRIMDGYGRVAASCGLSDGERLVASRMAGGDALLLCESPESRTQTVILLDSKGVELGRMSTGEKVRDMQVGANSVYLLTDKGISVYSRALELQRTVELGGVARILLSPDTLYYFTSEQICVLED